MRQKYFLKGSTNGLICVSGHLFFLLLLISSVYGCIFRQTQDALCNNKVSASLQSILSESVHDTVRISVTVIMTDSAGISESFPALSIPNAKVALGHLTKEEISSLCRHKNVQYIDIPKILFPNK